MAGADTPARSSTMKYTLVVSRGYVQLVRQGRQQSRRSYPSFVHRDGEWVEAEPVPVELGALEAAMALELDGDDEPYWSYDDLGRVDPVLQAAVEEDMRLRRGEAGQSARSRMNMRRMIVSLPWELLGPPRRGLSLLASSSVRAGDVPTLRLHQRRKVQT